MLGFYTILLHIVLTYLFNQKLIYAMKPGTNRRPVYPQNANSKPSETTIRARVWIKAVQGILSLQL